MATLAASFPNLRPAVETDPAREEPDEFTITELGFGAEEGGFELVDIVSFYTISFLIHIDRISTCRDGT